MDFEIIELESPVVVTPTLSIGEPGIQSRRRALEDVEDSHSYDDSTEDQSRILRFPTKDCYSRANCFCLMGISVAVILLGAIYFLIVVMPVMEVREIPDRGVLDGVIMMAMLLCSVLFIVSCSSLCCCKACGKKRMKGSRYKDSGILGDTAELKADISSREFTIRFSRVLCCCPWRWKKSFTLPFTEFKQCTLIDIRYKKVEIETGNSKSNDGIELIFEFSNGLKYRRETKSVTVEEAKDFLKSAGFEYTLRKIIKKEMVEKPKLGDWP
jgi:hypothetical protein